MRRIFLIALFALLCVSRTAGAQSAEQPAPAGSAAQVPACTAALTPYGWQPVCSSAVVDPAEFERQVSQYFTNGAAAMAMPSEGPAAGYYHDAASVLAAPTTPWGVPAPVPGAPPPAPTSSPPAVASSERAGGNAPAPTSTAALQVPPAEPAPVAPAAESPATSATTSSPAAPAPAEPTRQEAARETPPVNAQTPAPARAPSGAAPAPPRDVGAGVTWFSGAVPRSEPVMPPTRPPPSPPTPPTPKRSLEPLWAVIVAGGCIIGGLLYVIGSLIRRTRRPLGPRGVDHSHRGRASG